MLLKIKKRIISRKKTARSVQVFCLKIITGIFPCWIFQIITSATCGYEVETLIDGYWFSTGNWLNFLLIYSSQRLMRLCFHKLGFDPNWYYLISINTPKQFSDFVFVVSRILLFPSTCLRIIQPSHKKFPTERCFYYLQMQWSLEYTITL